jgi:hypothetical protein
MAGGGENKKRPKDEQFTNFPESLFSQQRAFGSED